MLLREIEDMVAACGNGAHFRIEPIDAFIGIHVQFGDKAASDKTNPYLRHAHSFDGDVILVGDQLLTPERGEEIANTMAGAGYTARLPSVDAGVPPRFPTQR